MTDGQSCDGFLGGTERHVYGTGNRFAVFQAVGNQAQRQSLDSRGRLLSRAPVCRDAGKGRDVREPATIDLTVILDGQ